MFFNLWSILEKNLRKNKQEKSSDGRRSSAWNFQHNILRLINALKEIGKKVRFECWQSLANKFEGSPSGRDDRRFS